MVADGLCDGLHHLQLLRVRQVAGMRSVAQYVRANVDVSPDVKVICCQIILIDIKKLRRQNLSVFGIINCFCVILDFVVMERFNDYRDGQKSTENNLVRYVRGF